MSDYRMSFMQDRPQYCLECGSKLPSQGKFCPECGTEIGASAGEDTTEEVAADVNADDTQVSEPTHDQSEDISVIATIIGFGAALLIIAGAPLPYAEICVDPGEVFGAPTCGEYETTQGPVLGSLFVGGALFTLMYNEHKDLGLLGTWRIKKANWLIIFAIIVVALMATTVDGNQGDARMGMWAHVAAIVIMVGYAIPSILIGALFGKRAGNR